MSLVQSIIFIKKIIKIKGVKIKERRQQRFWYERRKNEKKILINFNVLLIAIKHEAMLN